MRAMRCRLLAPLVTVSVSLVLAAGAGGATDPVVQLEHTLLKRYPGVAGPLLASSPLEARGLRVIYALGAVSVWYQARADRRPTCVAARANTAALRDAILGQVMPDAGSVRFWASRSISPARATSAFRAGILRACALRGG